MFDNHDDNDESCAFEERSDHDGFDLSAPEYDDIFELHRRFHTLTNAYTRARALIEPRIQEAGLTATIAQRVQETRMLGSMRLIALFGELTNREGAKRQETLTEMVRTLQTVDPLVLVDGLMAISKHYTDLVDQIDVGIAPLAHALGGFDIGSALLKPFYVQALRVSQHAQVALAEMALRSLVRILHGVPAWDAETGAEKPTTADPAMPTFDAEVYELLRENGVAVEAVAPANETAPQAVREDEAVLLDRLLSGLNLNLNL